jgi:hypothetical protein
VEDLFGFSTGSAGGGTIDCEGLTGTILFSLIFVEPGRTASYFTNTENIIVRNCSITTGGGGWISDYNNPFPGCSNIMATFENDSLIITNLNPDGNSPPLPGFICCGGTYNLWNQKVSLEDTNADDTALFITNAVVNLYGDNTFLVGQPPAGANHGICVTSGGTLILHGDPYVQGGIWITNGGIVVTNENLY